MESQSIVSQRVEIAIHERMPAADAERAVVLLRATPLPLLDAPEHARARDRVQLAVLLASRGDWGCFVVLAHEAAGDWRDVLVSAGLADADWPDVLRRAGIPPP